MRWLGWLLLGLVATLPRGASADPKYTLRMGTVVPEGTAWAREMKAFSRDVAQATNDEVRLKWYLGGIAGDDIEAGERIQRDQLDGVGAGAWQCERWAPTFGVTRLPGLFESRAEAKHVSSRLRSVLEAEFLRAGLIYLGDSEVGPSMVFTRNPIRTIDELRRVKLWSLDNDATKTKVMTALGLTLVPLPFDKSRAAFDDGRVDGFLAPPTGAMAFQWSTQARYLLDLHTDYIMACVVIAARAFDRLPIEHQRAVRAAAAKFSVRFDDVGLHADEELLGGLFERQGLKIIRPDASLRAAFSSAAHALWSKLDEKIVPQALLQQVQAMLTAYRAENAK